MLRGKAVAVEAPFYYIFLVLYNPYMETPRDAAWYQYLDHCQQSLIDTSFELIKRREHLLELHDYSFIVFPVAKAYEGFLKQILFDLHLISTKTFEGRRFRIGRALNPDIRENQRDEDWLYDDLARLFGESSARQLWDTWLACRNHVFHYFPDCKQDLSFEEAVAKVEMMTEAMQMVIDQIPHLAQQDKFVSRNKI